MDADKIVAANFSKTVVFRFLKLMKENVAGYTEHNYGLTISPAPLSSRLFTTDVPDGDGRTVHKNLEIYEYTYDFDTPITLKANRLPAGHILCNFGVYPTANMSQTFPDNSTDSLEYYYYSGNPQTLTLTQNSTWLTEIRTMKEPYQVKTISGGFTTLENDLTSSVYTVPMLFTGQYLNALKLGKDNTHLYALIVTRGTRLTEYTGARYGTLPVNYDLNFGNLGGPNSGLDIQYAGGSNGASSGFTIDWCDDTFSEPLDGSGGPSNSNGLPLTGGGELGAQWVGFKIPLDQFNENVPAWWVSVRTGVGNPPWENWDIIDECADPGAIKIK